MTQYINLMPGVFVIEPALEPINNEEFELNMANLTIILENARLRLSQETEE